MINKENESIYVHINSVVTIFPGVNRLVFRDISNKEFGTIKFVQKIDIAKVVLINSWFWKLIEFVFNNLTL